VKSVALLWQDYPSVNGHVRALREEAARRGLRVTSANRFASNTTDFTAAIAEANTPRSRERCATAGGARRVEGEAVDLRFSRQLTGATVCEGVFDAPKSWLLRFACT